MENSKLKTYLPLMEVGLLFLGVLLASVYGNNDLAYRLSAPLLLLLIGALSVAVRSFLSKDTSCFGGAMIPFAAALGYFCLRAIFSEVEAFGERDLILFGGMLCGAMLCLPRENRAWIGRLAPWAAVVAIVIQAVPVFWQWGDPTYVPFREVLGSKFQISGFFGHANFFALFVGLMGLILFSYLFGSRLENIRVPVRWGMRFIWLGGWVLSLFLLVSSHSRGALIAIILAHLVSLFGLFLLRGLQNKKKWKSSLMIAGISVIVIAFATGLVTSFVATKRGLDENFLFLNSRQDMLMMAADCEPTSKLLGGGSRFFQYEARRVWDTGRLNNTLNDPRVVHNEYVEALVNYGYIGFFSFLALLVLVVSLFLKNFVRVAAGENDSGTVLPLWIAIAGGLIAVLVQCLVDFTLHVLPLSILLGAMVGCVSYSMTRSKMAWASYGMGLVILAAMLVKLPSYWISIGTYEQARAIQREQPREASALYFKVGETTADFAQYEKAAQLLLRSNREGDLGLLKEAYTLFFKAWELHPNNGILALRCGKLAADLKQFDLAEEQLQRAIELVGASELDYGPRTALAIAKYKRLLSDEKMGFAHLSMDQQMERLRPCLQLIADSKAYRYRSRGVEAKTQKGIEQHFTQLNLMESAKQAEILGVNGDYSKSMAYILHTQRMYKRLKHSMKADTPTQFAKMMKLVNQQYGVLHKNKVVADKKLTQHLEFFVTFFPQNEVFYKKK